MALEGPTGSPQAYRQYIAVRTLGASFAVAQVALLLALASGCGGESERGEPTGVDANAPGSLLGVMWREAHGELVRFDPRSLKPLPSGRIPVNGASPWAYSPSGSHVALASCDEASAALRFVDVDRLRLVGDGLDVGPGCVVALGWILDERLVVAGDDPATSRAWAAVVDPRAHEVVRSQRLRGTIVGAEQGADGVVLLLAPRRAIGPVRLALLNAEGEVRSALLARTSAGHEFEEARQGTARQFRSERQREAALALDPEGRHAFVVGAGELVAEVDLSSLEVSYHELARPVSLLDRFLSWLDPVASAKGPVNGPTRVGISVGEGLVAVSGHDAHGSVDREGTYLQSTTAAGLELIDTRRWTTRTLDSDATFVSSSAGILLAYGAVSSMTASTTVTEGMEGIGLTAYTLDGEEVFHLFGEKPILDVQASGPYAYVGPAGDDRLHVIDLRSGRIVHERGIDWWPQLLLGRSAAWP